MTKIKPFSRRSFACIACKSPIFSLETTKSIVVARKTKGRYEKYFPTLLTCVCCVVAVVFVAGDAFFVAEMVDCCACNGANFVRLENSNSAAFGRPFLLLKLA